MQVSTTPRKELFITGEGPPDCATTTLMFLDILNPPEGYLTSQTIKIVFGYPLFQEMIRICFRWRTRFRVLY